MTLGVEQALHPLAHGGLGEADLLRDRGVGLAAVVLEQLDDGLADTSSRLTEGFLVPPPPLLATPRIVVMGR